MAFPIHYPGFPNKKPKLKTFRMSPRTREYSNIFVAILDLLRLPKRVNHCRVVVGKNVTLAEGALPMQEGRKKMQSGLRKRTGIISMSTCRKTDHVLTRRMLIALSCGLLGGISLARSGRVEAADASRIVQPVNPTRQAFIERAFAMRDMALSRGDQGYGAIIVNISNRRIVAQAPSLVVVAGDPTAHAEMEAIRDAARRLGTRDLSGHAMYSSSKPCPMCEAAAYWAGLDELYYGSSATAGGMPKLC